jgi:hypothetical protein
MVSQNELRLIEAWAKEQAELTHEEYKKVNPKLAARQEEIEQTQREEGRADFTKLYKPEPKRKE